MNDSLLQQIHDANTEALKRLTNARLCWIGWDTVAKLVPGITKNTILRSGPPLPFEKLTHTQQEGVINGAMLEHLAETREEAKEKILAGEILGADGGRAPRAVCRSKWSHPDSATEWS